MVHAANIAIDAAAKTGMHDAGMLDKLYRARRIYAYRDWYALMKNGTAEEKALMRRLGNDWMSGERTYWIIDRYSQYKMVQEQLLDPAYDDRQAKSMWLYAGDYVECMRHGFDPSGLISPEASAAAIAAVLQCSERLIGNGADPSRFLSFLKQDGFRKYTDWCLVSFIAMNDFQNPATVSWKEIMPAGTPETVVTSASSAIKDEGLDEAGREQAARGVLAMWDGFTGILEAYYHSAGIWGESAIYREWQADRRDYGAGLESMALARMASAAKK